MQALFGGKNSLRTGKTGEKTIYGGGKHDLRRKNTINTTLWKDIIPIYGSWLSRWLNGRLDGQMAGWLDGWMARWLDGWLSVWMAGWLEWLAVDSKNPCFDSKNPFWILRIPLWMEPETPIWGNLPDWDS